MLTSRNEWLFHHSHLAACRRPFGAAACGQEIVLALAVREDRAWQVRSVELRLWQDGPGETLLPMTSVEPDQGLVWYQAAFAAPAQACLVWYYFIVTLEHGEIVYYGNNAQKLGGEGQIAPWPPSSYQLTVVPATAATPDWWKEAVVYQIFPDRFYNPRGKPLNPKRGSLIHAYWDDDPVYIKDEAGRILAYDFFGGNLAGVVAKLPYLKDLGVSVIYFNPVFESPSNHKYDTADYTRIDPMFGDNALFEELCAKAAELGIAVLLDGVFSHTGSDSVYFNREGTYPGVGAYQSQESPYYPWFRFTEYPDRYECWWGVDALPNVNEMEPSYQDFIIDNENSVAKQWIRRGAKGWRLDVVDELPDAFVKKFRQSIKRLDQDSVLVGEVWEDASNKVSYGELRQYFWGEELDSVMNYPFRQAVLDFFLGRADARATHRILMSLYENYPKQHFYAAMNLIGSHDVPRALTLLGEGTPEEQLSGVAAKQKERLTPEQRRLGILQLKLAVLWQMTFPGTPAVYYGDEAGLEGYRDPLNRRTYPWGKADAALVSWYRQVIRLRNTYDVLKTGEWLSLPCQPDVYGYIRRIRAGQDVFGRAKQDNTAVVLLNRSLQPAAVTIAIPGFRGTQLYDLLHGEKSIPLGPEGLTLTLAPLDGKVFVENLAPRERGAGILLHPTSLPSRHGIGDMGADAYRFIDWLAEARQTYWQILPLNPPGYGNSPYQALSAFAGNPLLIAPDLLVETGLLKPAEAGQILADSSKTRSFRKNKVEFERVKTYKEALFRLAFSRFSAGCPEYRSFCREHAGWLEDYALFAALSEHFGGRAWTCWPQAIAAREPEALAGYRAALAEEIEYHCFLQYLFFTQWTALKLYANNCGVKLIGDLPLFVAHHSSDVWANPHLFALDDSGDPLKVAGVPPDYFSKTGQLWGNPQYDWERMQADDYRWWRRRLACLLSQVDIVRLDHFRGFEAYWEIPAGAKTAMNGRWVKGPGEAFFLTCARYLGDLPLVAEDLGVITPQVDALKHRFGFPGMQVLHFAFGSGDQTAPIPDERNVVVYTGTHDNNTTLGWLRNCRENEPALYQRVRHCLSAPPDASPETLCNLLLEFAFSRKADTVIIPIQDVLGLGGEARMNRPGTPTGNWGWRLADGALTDIISGKLAHLVEKSNR